MNTSAQNTGGVFPPNVTAGHRSFQYRASVDPENSEGETSFAHRLHYQQAFNDTFMWRLRAQARKTEKSNNDFDFLQAELFWEFNNDNPNYRSGVRFDARVRDEGRPSQFGVNWTHRFFLKDNWGARLVLLTSRQFGSDASSGINLQTRGRIDKRLSNGHTLGVEIFNNYGNTGNINSFDEQRHSLGPVYSFPAGRGWSIASRSLFGITGSSADFELSVAATKSL